MKIKNKSQFVCTECNHKAPKWIGRCPQCSNWNTFEEESIENNTLAKLSEAKAPQESDKPKLLKEVNIENYHRQETKIRELDRVLGGGLVGGSLNLLGGEPGIGKSTLLLNIIHNLSKYYQNIILYVSGEESEQQIAKRAERLNITSEKIYLYHCTCWEDIKDKVKKLKPKFLIIDSIQTTGSRELNSIPGSISQVREITYEVMNIAKAYNITTFIISHINKSGNIAGPKVMEHMVDTVLYFEGDQYGQYRILRGIKNRYGSNNEVGLFEMTERGLQEVRNPSKLFMEDHIEDTPGKTITAILEGSRPLFIEVQSLVVENKFGNARRNTQGIDQNRLAMLVAVIEKYFKIDISDNDIYINLVGGITIKSRDCDLAIIASILSSLFNKALPKDMIFLGEVGLTGEIRSLPKVESRIIEAEKLAFKTIITSKKLQKELASKFKIKIVGYSKAEEMLADLFKKDL